MHLVLFFSNNIILILNYMAPESSLKGTESSFEEKCHLDINQLYYFVNIWIAVHYLYWVKHDHYLERPLVILSASIYFSSKSRDKLILKMVWTWGSMPPSNSGGSKIEAGYFSLFQIKLKTALKLRTSFYLHLRFTSLCGVGWLV